MWLAFYYQRVGDSDARAVKQRAQLLQFVLVLSTVFISCFNRITFRTVQPRNYSYDATLYN